MKNILLVALLAVSLQAQATLLFEIDRISDTQATINASGSFTTSLSTVNPGLLSLDNIFGTTPGGDTYLNVFDSGSICWSTNNCYNSAYSLTSSLDNVDSLYILSATPAANDIISGAISITLLNGFTFADLGISGSVYSGLYNDYKVEAGTWSFTNAIGAPSGIPEPSIIALFGAGLFGLAFTKRRYRLK